MDGFDYMKVITIVHYNQLNDQFDKPGNFLDFQLDNVDGYDIVLSFIKHYFLYTL